MCRVPCHDLEFRNDGITRTSYHEYHLFSPMVTEDPVPGHPWLGPFNSVELGIQGRPGVIMEDIVIVPSE